MAERPRLHSALIERPRLHQFCSKPNPNLMLLLLFTLLLSNLSSQAQEDENFPLSTPLDDENGRPPSSPIVCCPLPSPYHPCCYLPLFHVATSLSSSSPINGEVLVKPEEDSSPC
ncbi:hypothetical protein LINGRAHAP2_LOCUS17397 [Linum grandiflorum]